MILRNINTRKILELSCNICYRDINSKEKHCNLSKIARMFLGKKQHCPSSSGMSVDTSSIDCLMYNTIRAINEELPSNRSLPTEARSYLRPAAIKRIGHSSAVAHIQRLLLNRQIRDRVTKKRTSTLLRTPIDSVFFVSSVRSFS